MPKSMNSTDPPNSCWLQWGATLGALIGLSCATTPTSPDGLREHFLTGRDVRFSQDCFITGVGQGNDASQARVNAFADIGAQIQSKIEGTLVSHEQMMTGPSGSVSLSQVTSDVRQHTTFDHNGLATVADTQVRDGKVYVLAVLDRAAAAEPFRRDVARTRGLLRHALEDVALAETKLDLRTAGRLAKEVRRRAPELAAALVIVESVTATPPSGGEWTDVAKAAQVDADLQRIRTKASVEICLTPDFPEASQLVQAIMDHVASLGMAALACGQSGSSAGGSASFRAEGRISAVFSTEAALGGAVFCRPSIDLRMVESSSGAEILSVSLGGDPARAAGRDREAATRAALKKLSALCAPRLSEAFGDVP
jgi:hypothetical protein